MSVSSQAKKEITGLMAQGFKLLSPYFTSSSSPPTSDSDQTTFPQGRVYLEISRLLLNH
jgi:hypothetical protein